MSKRTPHPLLTWEPLDKFSKKHIHFQQQQQSSDVHDAQHTSSSRSSPSPVEISIDYNMESSHMAANWHAVMGVIKLQTETLFTIGDRKVRKSMLDSRGLVDGCPSANLNVRFTALDSLVQSFKYCTSCMPLSFPQQSIYGWVQNLQLNHFAHLNATLTNIATARSVSFFRSACDCLSQIPRFHLVFPSPLLLFCRKVLSRTGHNVLIPRLRKLSFYNQSTRKGIVPTPFQ